MLYTAQYRYSGPDRLDITVKGQDPMGKVLAPTWAMVNGYKKDPSGFQQTYTDMYYHILGMRYSDHGGDAKLLLRIIGRAVNSDVTLVCFCPNGSFCHRYLAVKWLKHNFNIQYGGDK